MSPVTICVGGRRYAVDGGYYDDVSVDGDMVVMRRGGEIAAKVCVVEDGSACEDCGCTSHHLLPCPIPGCDGKAHMYKDVSGYYHVTCLKCGYGRGRSDVTQYWAATKWNGDARREGKQHG